MNRLDGRGQIKEVGELEATWRAGTSGASELADAAAHGWGVPRLREADLGLVTSLARDLSRRFLREAFACPVAMPDGRHVLVIADPSRRDVVDAVQLALGRSLAVAVASFEDIDRLFERIETAPDGEEPPQVETPGSADEVVTLDVSVDTLQDLARGAPIVRSIDQLLERAIEVGATDIHLETDRDQLRVRLRVDGLLRVEKAMPKHLAPAVISRIKILAGLDIAERRIPQDGRANLRVGSVEADLRVAIMPTLHGETAVLRILVKDARLLDLARIGMGAKDRETVAHLLAEPHGLIIVTGPTGSGKTTTLATAIAMLNDPARKILTIEDPVEYQIPGVHQTQVRSAVGITFATALRSFLRHDPDVIMVGEMRDSETAAIAVQAALTGHLVLTTLHTNSALDAVVRLVDMGVEPYLLGSTLRGIVGQRLVRRLCERCRAPGAALKDVLPRSGFPEVDVADGALSFRAVGCEACGHTGYRGRVGVFEIGRIDGMMRGLLRGAPDPDALRAAAREQGMTTMLEDAIQKVASGITSIEEVMRIIG